MLNFQFFNAAYVLFGVISAISASSFPYVENQIPFSITPHFIYVSSKPSAVFSGYSYVTQDFNGAASNVVFTTGPNSAKNLKMALNSMYKPMVTMPEKHLEMDMQNPSEESITSSTLSSESQNIEDAMSQMKNMPESNVQSFHEQMNELNKAEENPKTVKEDQTTPQPSPLLQNRLEKNSLHLHFPIVHPKLYVLPNLVETPHYDNSYSHVELPTYAFNNPFVPLVYQSPYVSTVSTFQDASINSKDFYNSYNIINDQNLRVNCSDSNVNNVIPKTGKTTPASEFVTNPMKNMLLNELIPQNSTEAKNSDNQSDSNKSDNADMKSENVTLPTKKTIDMSKM